MNYGFLFQIKIKSIIIIIIIIIIIKAPWVSYKFRGRRDQRLSDTDRFLDKETKSYYSCLVLYRHVIAHVCFSKPVFFRKIYGTNRLQSVLYLNSLHSLLLKYFDYFSLLHFFRKSLRHVLLAFNF